MCKVVSLKTETDKSRPSSSLEQSHSSFNRHCHFQHASSKSLVYQQSLIYSATQGQRFVNAQHINTLKSSIKKTSGEVNQSCFRRSMTPNKFIRRKFKAVFRKSKRPTMSEDINPNQHETEYIPEMMDHISNLPDFILHHILSFLTTKEVVKTSALSTRWKNIWASVTTINFDEGLQHARKQRSAVSSSFMNFVESVLRSRDASNLEKFRLSCYASSHDASRIHSCISYAITHNVLELDLCIFTKDASVIPESTFNNTSLVSLKIQMDCVIEIPSHVSFPSLKTLNLSLLQFPNDEFTEKLFSGCPFLEELSLLDCDFMNLKNILISISTLKRLTIHDHDRSSFEEFDDPSFCKIVIDATNLTYFKYIGNLTNEILLDNAFSLAKSCIHIPIHHEWENEVASKAAYLLKQLQHVVSLSVSNRIMQSLIYAENMIYYSPVFPNLRHLVLTMKSGDYPFGGLIDLLYLCPILQSICISEGFENHVSLCENDAIWLLIPICMSNSLKTVTFKNFHANDSETYFLKCILKYACVLEKMDILWSKTQLPDLKKQTKARMDIEMIKRSSTTCMIMFS